MASPMFFDRFPNDIRYLIFEELYHTCRLEHRRTTAYASVCSEWQTFFEEKHFERLAVTGPRISQFDVIVVRNRTQLVKHIWLDVQFDPLMDPRRPRRCQSRDEDKAFAYAIGTLFGSMSKWEKGPRAIKFGDIDLLPVALQAIDLPPVTLG
ncbi:hypothetical protein INS49_005027 [Diaporthe citri]|uniref:uncharacterized protein n=1 Tax=Diaporthe citri TaxID=83186 RepID=UPI001C815EDC|nr:uncharacterized protein INS49_005027 [Diaporthe citri]KAG6354056.1 hypothetical protein INS49_005027 [Diaporthe citri]